MRITSQQEKQALNILEPGRKVGVMSLELTRGIFATSLGSVCCRLSLHIRGVNDPKEGNTVPGRTKNLQEAAEDSLRPLVLGEEGQLFWLKDSATETATK